MNTRTEITELIEQLNQTWLNRRFEELPRYFHPDIVFVTPDLTHRIKGRDACVQSFRDFMTTVVHSFEPDQPTADVFGDAAVAVCPWRIEYDYAGERTRETGRDILMLQHDGRQWVVSWRTMLPDSVA